MARCGRSIAHDPISTTQLPECTSALSTTVVLFRCSTVFRVHSHADGARECDELSSVHPDRRSGPRSAGRGRFVGVPGLRRPVGASCAWPPPAGRGQGSSACRALRPGAGLPRAGPPPAGRGGGSSACGASTGPVAGLPACRASAGRSWTKSSDARASAGFSTGCSAKASSNASRPAHGPLAVSRALTSRFVCARSRWGARHPGRDFRPSVQYSPPAGERPSFTLQAPSPYRRLKWVSSPTYTAADRADLPPAWPANPSRRGRLRISYESPSGST